MPDATGEPVDLDAIRARCEAATPGPWKLEMEERYETGEKDAPYVYSADGSTCICSGQTYYPQQVTAANAAFIAAARSDIPALLASHAALEQRVALAEGLTRADTERLRQAEERVWPGMTHGCDAPEWMADEILALRQDKERAEQRIKELEEDLANATGGFDAAMGLADAEQERAKAAEQRVRELEAALDRVKRHRLFRTMFESAPCILCGYNGHDYYQPEAHPCAKVYHAALRGTGEGNRG